MLGAPKQSKGPLAFLQFLGPQIYTFTTGAVFIIFVESNIVTVAVRHILHVKKLTLIFDLLRSSKVKFDGANRKPVGPTHKCSRESNLVSVTVFKVFRVKRL